MIDAYADGDAETARDLQERVERFRLLVQDYAPIPAQKRLLALATGDERWSNTRPPLVEMPEDQGEELAAVLRREFGF